MQVNVEAPSEHVCSSSTVESINVYLMSASKVERTASKQQRQANTMAMGKD